MFACPSAYLKESNLRDDLRVPFPPGLAGSRKITDHDPVDLGPVAACTDCKMGDDVHLCLLIEPGAMAKRTILEVDDAL